MRAIPCIAALLVAGLAAMGGGAWADQGAAADTAAQANPTAAEPARTPPRRRRARSRQRRNLGTLSALAAAQSGEVENAKIDSASAEDRFVPTSSSYVRATDLDVTLGSKMDIARPRAGDGRSPTRS